MQLKTFSVMQKILLFKKFYSDYKILPSKKFLRPKKFPRLKKFPQLKKISATQYSATEKILTTPKKQCYSKKSQ